jgi:hypothetical protein
MLHRAEIHPAESGEMTIARTSLIMIALMLAHLAMSLPVVQADESSDAAMVRQLEEVRQQLRELQLKVQRMEAEGCAGSAAGRAASSAPTQTTITSPTTTPRTPAATEPAQAAPTPASTATQTEVAPPGGNPEPAAATRLEPGTPPTPPVVTQALEWHETLKEQWRSVKAGMSTEDIRKLLGSPSRELTLDGKPVWYYVYPGMGSGSVLFGRESHTVTGWQHPPLGSGFGFW